MLFRICCVALFCTISFMDMLAQNPAGQSPPAQPQPVPLGTPTPLTPTPMKPVLSRVAGWPGHYNSVKLSALVSAKMKLADTKPQLILMLESNRKENPEVFEKSYKIEQRIRTVSVNGKTKEQTYNVAVPVSKTSNAESAQPGRLNAKTIAANDLAFYDLAGQSISIDEASKRLVKLTPVFLLDRFRGTVQALPKIQQQALNPNCLIITSAAQIREPDPASYLPTY